MCVAIISVNSVNCPITVMCLLLGSNWISRHVLREIDDTEFKKREDLFNFRIANRGRNAPNGIRFVRYKYYQWDVRLWWWPSDMWRRVVRWISAGISKEPADSTSRTEQAAGSSNKRGTYIQSCTASHHAGWGGGITTKENQNSYWQHIKEWRQMKYGTDTA